MAHMHNSQDAADFLNDRPVPTRNAKTPSA